MDTAQKYSCFLSILKNIQRATFAPVLEQIERLEQRQEEGSKALRKFASAMSKYAVHLESHTEAVKSLADVSQDLREAMVEFGKILKRGGTSDRNQG